MPLQTNPITFEVPPLIPAPSSSRQSAPRPPLAALSTAHGPASSSVAIPSRPGPRDRRAFSFPNAAAGPADAVPLAKRSRESRVTQHALPPFARRSMAYAGPSKVPGLASTPEVWASPKLKHTAPDSVFCSTSDSSDIEVIDVGSPAKPAFVASVPANTALLPPVPEPIAAALLSAAESPKRDRDSRYSSLRSQLSTARAGSYLTARKVSSPHSPVAALIASSASSRSREDIISWAKAIELRETDSESEAPSPTSPRRGRSRTRRKSEFARFSPQAEETGTRTPAAAEPDATQQMATTPKGFTSALAGLSIVQPLVKAITGSVSLSRTSTKNGNWSPPQQAVYRAMPVPAELCKVAVVASTGPAEAEWPPHMLGGATPTLSTISISELPEFSVTTDPPDHADMSADDMSTASASFVRRPTIRARTSVVSDGKPKARSNIPGVQASANAIWQFSSYIRSLAPFSMPFMPAYSSTPYPEPPPGDIETPTPSSPSAEHTPGLPSPLPASRAGLSSSEDNADAGKELVRSLPMDIVMPALKAAQAVQASEARAREREAQEWLAQHQLQHLPETDTGIGMDAERGRLGHMTSRSRGSRGRSGSRARKDRDAVIDVERGVPELSAVQAVREERDGSEADAEDEERRGRGRRGRGRGVHA